MQNLEQSYTSKFPWVNSKITHQPRPASHPGWYVPFWELVATMSFSSGTFVFETIFVGATPNLTEDRVADTGTGLKFQASIWSQDTLERLFAWRKGGKWWSNELHQVCQRASGNVSNFGDCGAVWTEMITRLNLTNAIQIIMSFASQSSEQSNKRILILKGWKLWESSQCLLENKWHDSRTTGVRHCIGIGHSEAAFCATQVYFAMFSPKKQKNLCTTNQENKNTHV